MNIAVNVEISNQEMESVQSLLDTAYELAMEFGRELVRQALERQDEELAAERDKKRLRNKGKRQTSIKSRLGVIEYERTVYTDNAAAEGSRTVYLLDEMMEMETIGLVSEDICQEAASAVCESSYRAAARHITETTELSISVQGVWNIVQEMGTRRKAQIERQAEQAEKHCGSGKIESRILYEENDGIWLKLQGASRAEYGSSREMKVGIAYDGVTWQTGKGGKKRRKLDCKVAYASFESSREFRQNKEGVVASRFDVDEIELRVINGDGAQWIQKHGDSNCISVLDKYHRNRKITECVRDPEFAELLRTLLREKRIDDLIDCLEGQMNSVADTQEKELLRELYLYFFNNKDALLDYYDRGETIPPTRDPGNIHHALLGAMESNVFTLIGNRMKGRRSCWSIQGANNLGLILCAYHTSGLEEMFAFRIPERELPAQVPENKLTAYSAPKADGHGYRFWNEGSSSATWVRKITGMRSFTELKYT